jgi:hypothetical protein
VSVFPGVFDPAALKAQALEAVERICAEAGWRTEQVAFGAETELKVAIPSGCALPDLTLWITVEAKRNLTQFRREGAHYLVPIGREAAARSLARRETTLAVLWNTERKVGFWMVLHYAIPELVFLLEETQRTDILFHDDLRFAADTVERIAQVARVERCETMLSLALAQARPFAPEEEDGEDAQAVVVATVGQALEVLGLATKGEATPLAVAEFRRARLVVRDEIRSEELDLDEADADLEALARVVEDRVAELSGSFLTPRDIEEHAPAFLAVMLEESGEIGKGEAEEE